MGVSSILSSLRNNIVGQNSTPTNPSLPTKRTPIEIAQDVGPLAGLGHDPLGFSTHAYPLDVVNNPEIGHYMLFYINVQNNTTFPYTDVRGVDIKGRTIIKEENPNPALTSKPYEEITYTGHEYFLGGGAIEGSEKNNLKHTKAIQTMNADVQTLRKEKTKMKTGALANLESFTTKRIMDSIAIYLPPNVQDNYTTSYNAAATGLIGFATAAGITASEAFRKGDMKTVARTILTTAGGGLEEMLRRAGLSIAEMLTDAEGGVELANKVFGRAANPYLEVLFQGPELRTFTYNFTFAPKSKEEQDEVHKIIKLFRFHQAPEHRSDHSMFLGLPSEFDIHYMYQGSTEGEESGENQFYNKIATCVLQNVNVDYTPGKVASHQSGAPVLIKMSLTFLETEMITKSHIQAGY
jgi:hypothetical protein